MATYAIISSDNFVQTLVAADTIEDAELVFQSYLVVPVSPETMCQQGYKYDEITKEFTKVETDEATSI